MTAPALRFGPVDSHCLPAFDYFLGLSAFFVFIKSKQKNFLIEPAVSELSAITNDSIQLEFFPQVCVNLKSVYHLMKSDAFALGAHIVRNWICLANFTTIER